MVWTRSTPIDHKEVTFSSFPTPPLRRWSHPCIYSCHVPGISTFTSSASTTGAARTKPIENLSLVSVSVSLTMRSYHLMLHWVKSAEDESNNHFAIAILILRYTTTEWFVFVCMWSLGSCIEEGTRDRGVCLRTGFWDEYLGPRGTWMGSGEGFIMRNFILFT